MASSKSTLGNPIPSTPNDQLIDRIYEIALDPSSLDELINFWHENDYCNQISNASDKETEHFDYHYKTHLERAQTFMQRGQDAHPDLYQYLQPFENLAAFIVNSSLRVEASNEGGFSIFGAIAGNNINDLCMPEQVRDGLKQSVKDILSCSEITDKLLKVELDSKSGSLLFRVVQLEKCVDDIPAVLVISTQFHWQETVSQLLGNMFQLTLAEQTIIRLLTEGKNADQISEERKTSKGTVRGQIKTIIGKLNVRNQSDIIRLAMALNKLPAGSKSNSVPVTANLTKDWIEAEVWKPFQAITLPDHRRFTYHEMGPQTGNPILFSHMGSCMVRWSRSMIHLAFENNLRVICPIRAGYGNSDHLAANADLFASTRNDTNFLLNSLRVERLPYAVQGSDIPLAADMIANNPEKISELIAIGGQLRLPGNLHMHGKGRWQRFFVTAACNSPSLAQFAAKAVMAMSRRIGPEAMLYQLCKESPADLAIIEREEMRQVLVENLNLMASKSTNAGQAFAMDYIAFQQDWSDCMMATQHIPVKMFIASEDPTNDIGALPQYRKAFPWVEFEIVENAGLALMYQKPQKLISLMAEAAKRAI